MEIKDLIKEKRKELGYTYQQLGELVGVGKSTVRKWETGMVENMKRDNIIALARALNISPSLLIGWDIEDAMLKPKITISKCEIDYIEDLRKLNDDGISKAINYTKDLTEIPKYKKTAHIIEVPKKEIWEETVKEDLMPIACHDYELTED